MKIGIFDHVEHGERPLATLYDERLEFAAAADAAGIYGLHVAEHHQTPLNLVPSPSVYLAAVARATKRVRFGPIVYLLPLYSPLRLIEEICMLDHLSRGRLDVGVGRGCRPTSSKFHKVEHDDARDIFIDAFGCLSAGLTSDTLSYTGKYYEYKNVPIAMRPLQQPQPPFWYASSNATGSTWGGEQGMHYVTLGPTAAAKTNIDTFKAALAKRGGPASRRPAFPAAPSSASAPHLPRRHRRRSAPLRQAGDGGAPRQPQLVARQTRRHRAHLAPRHPARPDFEDTIANGSSIVGSPATVRAEIERQVRELGVNYLLTYLFLGTMSLTEALRSLALFRDEVMPHLAEL